MRYLIDGCYGDGNVGDECLLEAMCRLIRRVDPQASIHALSSDTADTEQEHGLAAVPQCNPFGRNIYGSLVKGLLKQTLREIRACDLFVIGGGELFRDSPGMSATLGMFYRARIARALGKPVVALGVGAQTPTKRWGPTVLRHALRSTDGLLFRDPIGLEVARRLAGELPDARWAPDPVFSLEWDISPQDQDRDQSVTTIGVALKSLPATHASFSGVHHQLPNVLGDALKDLSTNRSLRIRLLPFSRDDVPFARSLADVLKALRPDVAPPQKDALKATIADLDVLVAVPLHASVFAFSMGVPAVGLAYDPKVRRLYANFDVSENCLPIAELDARWISDRVEHLLANRRHLGTTLRDKATQSAARFQDAGTEVLASARRETLRLSSRTGEDGQTRSGVQEV